MTAYNSFLYAAYNSFLYVVYNSPSNLLIRTGGMALNGLDCLPCLLGLAFRFHRQSITGGGGKAKGISVKNIGVKVLITNRIIRKCNVKRRELLGE